ncbi:MAG: HEAT repeat domain-containing protein [Acidobacteriaceae bacterium]|nr:HEAT repeat domain-containing protein [Acidobacteriaceae bacterium]MBV9778379.1 HEAT repeat domain-containing protein [Acidobacteriaceae bacterium]
MSPLLPYLPRLLLAPLVLATISPASEITDRSWSILQAALEDKSSDKRVKALHALSLLTNNAQAGDLAEKALADPSPHVRSAAAKSLGQMKAAAARPKLREALNDPEIEVVIAAANALYVFKDPAAYEVYYALLTGERKSSAGILRTELKSLKDRHTIEKMAFETGIGFVPFGGMGYEAWKTVTQDDTSPVRAAAAERLATDPDAKSGTALAHECSDNKWRVRQAAVDAIAARGDPALSYGLIAVLEDPNDNVRFDAAAAIIRFNTAKPRQRIHKPVPR